MKFTIINVQFRHKLVQNRKLLHLEGEKLDKHFFGVFSRLTPKLITKMHKYLDVSTVIKLPFMSCGTSFRSCSSLSRRCNLISGTAHLMSFQ